jgi:hypothetical protein
MKKLLISIVTILTLSGCSSFDFSVIEEPGFQIAIKQVTGRYIEKAHNSIERAVRVVSKATEIKNFLDLQPRTLVELKKYFQRRIISKSATDADSLLLLDLADLIELRMDTDIQAGTISPEQTITINNTLDLIISRSMLYIPL